MRRLLPFLALPFAAGCTFLNLDGFDVPSCTNAGATPAEQAMACAEALGAQDGFPAGCVPYVCQQDTGQCVLIGGGEICDGLDNDCDAKIDEAAGSEARVLAPTYDPPSLIQTNEPTEFRVATTGTLPRVTWTDTDGKGFVSSLAIDATPEELFWSRNADISSVGPAADATTEAGEPNNCYVRSTPGSGVAVTDDGPDPAGFRIGRCNFARVAPAVYEDTGFVAALNTNGCAPGQLRVGHTSPGGADRVLQLGPPGRANSFFGLSLTPDGRCTATDPLACAEAQEVFEALPTTCAAACGEDEECIGGVCSARFCADASACGTGLECLCGRCRHPDAIPYLRACGLGALNMAATDRETGEETVAQGLVAGISGAVGALDCNEVPRDVAINGVQFERQSGRERVQSTDEGRLQVIGQTLGAAAPAVLAVERLELIGFVVAYSDLDQDVVLEVVNELPPLRATQATTCETLAGEPQMCLPLQTDGGEAIFQPSVCSETDCGTDEGLCVSGRRSCEAGTAFCEGLVRPRPELCGSGEDEDCDGVVDENPAELPCVSAAEGCAPEGTDACDGRDDDCDGRVDEHAAAELADSCAAPGAPSDRGICGGVPACRGGVVVCEGASRQRQEPAGIPRDVCGNGLDDDCDGTVDEDGGTPTTRCLAETCDEGMQGMATGGNEFCDAEDDDGDCAVDESLGNAISIADVDLLPVRSSQRPPEVIRQCMTVPPIAAEELREFTLQGNLDLADGVVDDLAIAIGPATDESVTLGITWRERGPGGRSLIGFRSAILDLECECRIGTVSTCDVGCAEESRRIVALNDATPPQRVTVEEGDYGAQAIAYAPAGFLDERLARDGTTLEMPAEGGGWFVTWTAPDGASREVRVRRFAARDGLAIEACTEEPCGYGIVEDTTLRGGRPPVASSPLLFEDTIRGARFVYYDENNAELISGELQTCDGSVDAPGT
ncbi:MAG: MopE-related protein [Myxococcota bacterium]